MYGLPAVPPSIEVLGYSFTISRDACAHGSSVVVYTEEGVDSLVSKGPLGDAFISSSVLVLEINTIIKQENHNMGEIQGNYQVIKGVCTQGSRRDIAADCLYGRMYKQKREQMMGPFSCYSNAFLMKTFQS
ncbi:hypothetical protein BVRB_4g072300 [Beta vulgaris subsp. vulgaris]|nr:hypothetical protein BVRB_4g072300 [Beta vulgaris subsp. vulgaris]